MWVIDFWAGEDGQKQIRSFLLECPSRSVRQHFSKMIENSLSSFFKHEAQTVRDNRISLATFTNLFITANYTFPADPT